MNKRYKLLLLFLTIIAIYKYFQYFGIFSSKEESNGLAIISEIKVSIYYEALCPDSKFFIIHQLLPVFKKLQDNLVVDLVPYGKAKTEEVNGKILFYCQHDKVECFANKIHACVIDLVQNPILQLKYVACMISDNVIPDDAGEKCGQELNIDYTPIGECANSDKGSQLLKAYGERTHALDPPVKFIPTIELNGSQTKVPQSAILKNLLSSVCQLFLNKPKSCG